MKANSAHGLLNNECMNGQQRKSQGESTYNMISFMLLNKLAWETRVCGNLRGKDITIRSIMTLEALYSAWSLSACILNYV